MKIFSSGEGRKKFVEVVICFYWKLLISSSLTINSVREALLGKIFKNITRLRLFNGEGVEIFEEDIRFLKDKEVLYASASKFHNLVQGEKILIHWAISVSIRSSRFWEREDLVRLCWESIR